MFSGVLMPGIGVLREARPMWILLGTLGIVVFAVAQAGALYGSVTPSRSAAASKRWLVAFGIASAASLALVAPVAQGEWATWSWIGAAIIGTVPLMLPPVRVVAWRRGHRRRAIVAVVVGGSMLESVIIVARRRLARARELEPSVALESRRRCAGRT